MKEIGWEIKLPGILRFLRRFVLTHINLRWYCILAGISR